MNKITTVTAAPPPARMAVVEHRSSRGGPKYIWPVRVYIAMVPLNDKGKPVLPRDMTKTEDWAFKIENQRATRRLRNLNDLAEALAAKVNAGEVSFEQAKTIFMN